MKPLRFLVALIVLNALFFYGVGPVDITNLQLAFGILIVNSLLAPMAFMLTMLQPKNQ